MSPPKEQLQAARIALGEGKADEALRALSLALRYPDPHPEETFPERMLLLGDVALASQRGCLASLAREVAYDPDRPQALFHLGYELYERGLFDASAAVLARGHRLAPEDVEILTELAGSLECAGHHEEACRVLRGSERLFDRAPICRYLLAYNAILSLDLATARGQLPALKRVRNAETRFMTSRIERILARADLCAGVTALDGRDLAGWHFVLTGGLLLHRSPHGFDEGMLGRYAYLQDSSALCALGLQRLRRVLSSLAVPVGQVLLMPERPHQILGLAAARVLGLPAVPWAPDVPGLVVIHTLEGLAQAEATKLQRRTPGQIVFSHGTRWTTSFPFAPDLTTLLYQRLSPPQGWGPGEASEGPSSAEKLAKEITRTAPEDLELPGQEGQVQRLARACAPHLLAGWRQPGERERLLDASPVKSSRLL